MRIEDPDLLQRFGQKIRCEWCQKVKLTGMDPAHIKARGLGGGHRIDHKCNLVALCRVCHNAHHNGRSPTRAELWKIASRREKCDAEAVILEIARRPKEWKP